MPPVVHQTPPEIGCARAALTRVARHLSYAALHPRRVCAARARAPCQALGQTAQPVPFRWTHHLSCSSATGVHARSVPAPSALHHTSHRAACVAQLRAARALRPLPRALRQRHARRRRRRAARARALLGGARLRRPFACMEGMCGTGCTVASLLAFACMRPRPGLRCFHAGAPLLLELLLARPGRCMLHAEGSSLLGTLTDAVLPTSESHAAPAAWGGERSQEAGSRASLGGARTRSPTGPCC